MIYIVIVILIVILLFLLVDWQKILNRWRNRTAEKNKRYQPPARGSKDPREVFSFETPPYEEVESILREEEVTPYQASEEVEKLLAEADIHFRKGEMKAAENLYLQAASKDPRCSKAYSRLGVIYLEHGDNWQDAEEAFRQALKTDSRNGFILNNLGLVLYHQDHYADAIRQFEMAVRQDDLNASRHANLGMAYMAMRQYAKAESAFKKALKLAPSEMEYKDLLNESIEKKKAHKTMIRR